MRQSPFWFVTPRSVQLPSYLLLASVWILTGVQLATGRTTAPHLPEQPFDYAGIALPAHYRSADFPSGRQNSGSAADQDNTPASNPITNAGATLGRVLFYDRNLSANGSTACASCHVQEHGFSDPDRLSRGFEGGLTRRRSMGLTNARFYRTGRFFWDERAATLEEQVLMPFQDPVEMGLTLSQLERLVRAQTYYSRLFQAAFGSPEVTSDRIARALAQFVRSLVSVDTKYDRGRSSVSSPLSPFPNFTEQENRGKRLFMTNGGVGRTPCTVCHQSEAMVTPGPPRGRGTFTGASNNGLDARSITDRGVAETTGNGGDTGKFKSPSLRDVAVRAPYMHDGRFATLEAVIDHYSDGIQGHPNLAGALNERNGRPERYNFAEDEKSALVAFLRTLTDETLLSHEMFGDPFVDPSVPTILAVMNSDGSEGVIADHAWITVRGRNLSAVARTWADATPSGIDLPEALGGTVLMINGKSARLYSVSPSRIRALAPADAVVGDVQVQVITARGKSNSVIASRTALSPTLLLFDVADSEGEPRSPQRFLDAFATDSLGSRYLAALHSDGTRAVRNGFSPGVTTRPARAGDRITIFGCGFGDTATETPFGQLIATPVPLADQVRLRFGEVPAGVVAASMVAPGLYEFEVIVPAVENGDIEVTAEIDGIKSQASVFLTVQR